MNLRFWLTAVGSRIRLAAVAIFAEEVGSGLEHMIGMYP
jgi:hypothetical protein